MEKKNTKGFRMLDVGKTHRYIALALKDGLVVDQQARRSPVLTDASAGKVEAG